MTTQQHIIGERTLEDIGRLTIRHFVGATDTAIAHRWLTDPHAHYWGMTRQSAADTERYFEAIAASTTHEAWLGYHESAPAFLVETYDPAADVVGAYYPVAVGDRGFHILIAPPTQRIPGFTWAVFSFVVASLFADQTVARLVVEPDVDNHAIQRLNARVGFAVACRLQMDDKSALLSFCTRRAHVQATQQAFSEALS